MRVTVEGLVQTVEPPANGGPGKSYLLQSAQGQKPVICEVNYWPPRDGKPGCVQKPGEIGKVVRVTGIARGNQYGVSLRAD